MASGRRKAEDYPRQVVTKRGIVELRLSPASMHELLTGRLRMTADDVVRMAEEEIERHPRRETFWKLVAYVALSTPQRRGASAASRREAAPWDEAARASARDRPTEDPEVLGQQFEALRPRL